MKKIFHIFCLLMSGTYVPEHCQKLSVFEDFKEDLK